MLNPLVTRRARRRGLLAAVTAAVVLVGCSAPSSPRQLAVDDNTTAPPAATSERSTSPPRKPDGWARLADPPLDGRTDAGLVAVDTNRVVVLGGWAFACDPAAACVGPEDPPFDDAAVLDLEDESWRVLPAMPVGVVAPATVAIDDLVYALATCPNHEECGRDPALLRLDLATETWDTFPAPTARTHSRLVALDDRVVHVVDSDESGEVPDEVFDPATGAWTSLPDDPLPDTYDRFAVHHDGRLFLFGSPITGAGTTSTKLGAVYDPEQQAWSQLPESGSPGYQVWDVGDRLVLNGHFGLDQGGLFDPSSRTWSDLPAPPDDPSWEGDMAGTVGGDTAAYEYTDGWILVTTIRSWVAVPPRPGADAVHDQEAVAAVGRSLVVFGGARWPDGGGGGLLAEAWVWTPPEP